MTHTNGTAWLALTGPDRNDTATLEPEHIEAIHTNDQCLCCRVVRQLLETQRRLLSERQALERQLRAAGRATAELAKVLGKTPAEFCEEEARV